MSSQNQSQWSSQLSFIWAATGAAVGLGNIWKFPYMAGSHGGSAFVLVYFLAVLGFGLPIMAAEMVIGRLGRCNAVASLKQLALRYQASPLWQSIGYLGAFALLLILAFYSVVAGWSLGYLKIALTQSFSSLSTPEIHGLWGNFLSSPWQLLLYHSLFMLLTIAVVARGVEKGLEKASHWMMPALFFILLVLAVYASNLSGFGEGVRYLFQFDFSQITTSVVLAALGQAFFTLAIGAGCMLAYGAYLQDDTPIFRAIGIIAFLDVLVAILSGMVIFPILNTYHLASASGAGLMYQTLPIAFAQMPWGQFVGGLFFLLLLFAAWSSSISLLEPLVLLLTEKTRLNRLQSACLMGLAAWVLGIGCLLSFNLWKDVKLFGVWDIFTSITTLSTDILLPVGGLGFAWFAGYILPESVCETLLKLPKPYLKLWRFSVRVIAPVGLVLILSHSLFGLV